MKKFTRRQFISAPPKIAAYATLAGALGPLCACSSNSSKPSPNILLIMVDQMQTPPEGYQPDEGVAQGLKEIFGFRTLSPDNAYTRFFPGLLRIRQNAVVLRKHHTASSACVPSRACIMTGQYPGVTGVTQTDGLFKSAAEVPFLDPEGTPTIGDWFRAAGYKTHYFGKWHVSEANEETDYLESWGFSEWESSYPEAHGGGSDNSGTYRDVGFADNVADFLRDKGADSSSTPWFAVGSLLNPHDCSNWPLTWQMLKDSGVVPWSNYPPPPSIPHQGQQSLPGGVSGSEVVDLNPKGFPQNNSTLPPTYFELLDSKPRCQQDYALKWGLAFGAKIDNSFGGAHVSPLPFQLRGEYAKDWSLGYNQFYFYCHYLVDMQIHKIMQALDDNGLADNTLVVFLSDHGELAGAHGGMIQKWHNAYEEAVRVPMVISSPLINENKQVMREILQPTSSIDFAPTLLALAGYAEEQVRVLMESIHGAAVVKPFVGADLSSHVKGESTGEILGPDGAPRPGVFFMSNDTITACNEDPPPPEYDLFVRRVNEAIDNGRPLVPGSVRQPNNVRALCTGDWKIVRYLDPNNVEPDEWELYCLTADPVEKINLVDFRTGEVRNEVSVPGMTNDELKLKTARLKLELARQEAAMLG